ncbi:MAG: SPFH domain-containing protein [Coxiellaceae bacterium]|nr:SPFH domain-containing protein [Coxiellaceae bacterium]
MSRKGGKKAHGDYELLSDAEPSRTRPAASAPLAPRSSLRESKHGDGIVREQVGETWPADLIKPSAALLSTPQYQGGEGFRDMYQALYSKAVSKTGGTSMIWDEIVRQGELGYFISRGGELHLLGPGRHWTGLFSTDSKCKKVSLSTDEIHLPPATPGAPSRFHIVRVNPGEVVAYQSRGVGGFLTAGVDTDGRSVPGYHVIDNDQTFRVTQRHNINQQRVVAHSGPNWILNVPPGEVCKAYVGSKPVLLSEGQHIFNNANFRIGDNPFVCNSSRHIQHGNLNIIRLSRGEMMAVKDGTNYHLLGAQQLLDEEILEQSNADMLDKRDPTEPLVYKINSPLFQVLKLSGAGDRPAVFRTSDPLIQAGSLTVAYVREGTLLRTWNKGKPEFLEARDKPYVINDPAIRLASETDPNPDYRYPALVSKGANVIRHGTKCRIFVPDGQVFLGHMRGQAVILGARKLMKDREGLSDVLDRIDPSELIGEDGSYIIDDPSFRLIDETAPAVHGIPPYQHNGLVGEHDIQHGNVTIMQVKPGEVAVVKDRETDKNIIYPAGTHLVESPQQTLIGKLACSEQQLVMDLEELDAQTSDFHKLMINASITYQINDPKLAAQQTNLRNSLQKQCHAALGNCISSTKLEHMGRGNVLHHLGEDDKKSEESKDEGNEQPADEFHRAFDSAKAILSESLESIGIHLVGINIQQWHPVNEHVSASLEEANLTTLTAMRDVTTTEAAALKQAAKAKGDAATMVAAAEGEAQARLAAASADSQAKVQAAEAHQKEQQIQADGVLALARAQAEAALVEAKAHAEAAKLRAEGELALATAEAKGIELKGLAEAENSKRQMEALSHAPAGHWAVEAEKARSQLFSRASLNVTSAEFSKLWMLAASNPIMNQMQQPVAGMPGQMPGMIPTGSSIASMAVAAPPTLFRPRSPAAAPSSPVAAPSATGTADHTAEKERSRTAAIG